MAEWLIRHLETIGAMGPDRIGRTAKTRRCARCGRSVLTGLDGDRMASVAHADLLPLAPIGEAVALMSGRRTYALHIGIGVCELQRRDRWQISGTPAGTRLDVLAEHTCTAVNLPAVASVNRPPSEPLPARPPF